MASVLRSTKPHASIKQCQRTQNKISNSTVEQSSHIFLLSLHAGGKKKWPNTSLISTEEPLTTCKPFALSPSFVAIPRKFKTSFSNTKTTFRSLSYKISHSRSYSGSLRPGQKGLKSPEIHLLRKGPPFHLCKEHCGGQQPCGGTAQSTLKAMQLWLYSPLSGLRGGLPFPLSYMNNMDFTAQEELTVVKWL